MFRILRILYCNHYSRHKILHGCRAPEQADQTLFGSAPTWLMQLVIAFLPFFVYVEMSITGLGFYRQLFFSPFHLLFPGWILNVIYPHSPHHGLPLSTHTIMRKIICLLASGEYADICAWIFLVICSPQVPKHTHPDFALETWANISSYNLIWALKAMWPAFMNTFYVWWFSTHVTITRSQF